MSHTIVLLGTVVKRVLFHLHNNHSLNYCRLKKTPRHYWEADHWTLDQNYWHRPPPDIPSQQNRQDKKPTHHGFFEENPEKKQACLVCHK